MELQFSRLFLSQMGPFFSCLYSPKQDANLPGREEASKAAVSPLAELPALFSMDSAVLEGHKARLGTEQQQPQLNLKSKGSPVTVSLSLQGAFLQHRTAARGLIKAWKSWSSGNAEEKPAQPVGSWHLLWLSTEPASTGTSCGIFSMDSTQQQQKHPAPQSGVSPARPWSGSSRAPALQGRVGYLLLPSLRAFRQLKASLELPSAHHTACNCVCNARGSSALKPHSQPWMSPGVCTFPTAATHPARSP